MQSFWERYFFGKEAYRTFWYAFLIAFPFSWRKVLIPTVGGSTPFNEYLDISLYISDLLLFFCLYLIIKHKYNNKSIFKQIRVFHVEQITLLMILFYTLINFYISPSKMLWLDTFLGIMRIASVGYITYYYFLQDKTCSTWNKMILLYILMGSLLFQVFLGMFQYVSNQSLGLTVLNESVLSPNMSGVAKIDFEDGKQIRSYGTFLHPNIFAGYIATIFAIFLVFIKWYMFHVEQKWHYLKKFHVEQWAIFIFSSICLLGLYLSHSKSGILSFWLVFIFYMFHVEQKWHYLKKFHVEHIVFLITSVTLIWIFQQSDINQSINERIDISNSYMLLEQSLLIGHGLGQGVYILSQQDAYMLEWKIQPIHNIFLICLLEYGILGVAVLLLFMIVCLRKLNVPRGTSGFHWLPISVIFVLGIFDHYPLDIYVGNILFGLSIGCLFLNRVIYIDKR